MVTLAARERKALAMTTGPDRATAATLASVARLIAARPVWIGVVPASSLLTPERKLLLHAGPEFREVSEIPQPVMNAAAAAILFEGWAPDRPGALAAIRSGAVTLHPAQDHGVVTPLAFVVSPSMWFAVLSDSALGIERYSPINEGGGLEAARFGTDHPDVAERLRQIHGTVGPALSALLDEPVDPLAICRQALGRGDDMHGRVGVGSALLAAFAEARLGAAHPATAYLKSAGQFFLNIWMAASAVMLAAGAGIAGSSLVTAAGGNGHAFGIKIAGASERWFTAQVGAPIGPNLPQTRQPVARLPAVGDSAVIDAVGLGALALDAAPDLAAQFEPAAVSRAAAAADSLLVGHHPILDRAVGLDAAAVVRTGLLPGVCLAALDAAGHQGLIGRGLADHPLECHRAAVAALVARQGREP